MTVSGHQGNSSSLEWLEKSKFAVAAKVTFGTGGPCGPPQAGGVLGGLTAVLRKTCISPSMVHSVGVHAPLFHCLLINLSLSDCGLIAQRIVMFRNAYMA